MCCFVYAQEPVVVSLTNQGEGNSFDEDSDTNMDSQEKVAIVDGKPSEKTEPGGLREISNNNVDDIDVAPLNTSTDPCTVSNDAKIQLPQGLRLTMIEDIQLGPEDVGHALQFLEFCATFGQASFNLVLFYFLL